MTAPNSFPEEVRQIRDGHLLRWTKQMALRGRSREFDEAGVCGTQKLVVTGDLRLLMPTSIASSRRQVQLEGDSKATNLEKLLRYLSTPGLLSRVSTKADQRALRASVAQNFGRPHRTSGFQSLLHNAGWSYLSKARSSRGLLRADRGRLANGWGTWGPPKASRRTPQAQTGRCGSSAATGGRMAPMSTAGH